MTTKKKSTTTAEEKWDDWAETAWRVGSLGTHQIAKLSREAYKSALRKAIEEDIKWKTAKIKSLTATQSLGYITQREQNEWFLRLLDTVQPE